MEFCVLSLGDWKPDPHSGLRMSQAQRYRDVVELGVLAEELGFAGFHLGEHHFCDYIISNPALILAHVAARTKRIRLSTGVTLAANRDPVLVAEDYAALDVLSQGRAEIVAGRGNAFLEAYRQFGQDLARSRIDFEHNVELLLRIWREERVSAPAQTRPALEEVRVQPRPFGPAHPAIWIGGGSSLDSAAYAAKHGLGLQLPGVFAPPQAFRAVADHYRAAFHIGVWEQTPRIGYTAHVHVGADGPAARRDWEAYHLAYLDWAWRMISDGSKGAIPAAPPRKADKTLIDPATAVSLCGSPNEVAERLAAWRETLGGMDRVLLKFDGGALPMARVRAAMELFMAEVAPQLA